MCGYRLARNEPMFGSTLHTQEFISNHQVLSRDHVYDILCGSNFPFILVKIGKYHV